MFLLFAECSPDQYCGFDVKAENEDWASRRGGGSDDRGPWTSTIEAEVGSREVHLEWSERS
jgi:hypothetical protein